MCCKKDSAECAEMEEYAKWEKARLLKIPEWTIVNLLTSGVTDICPISQLTQDDHAC